MALAGVQNRVSVLGQRGRPPDDVLDFGADGGRFGFPFHFGQILPYRGPLPAVPDLAEDGVEGDALIVPCESRGVGLRVAVAVAYLSSDTRFRLRPGDVAIVNASDAAITGGQTSAAVLDAAWTAGVKRLYSNNRLHAKVVITLKAVLGGSANLLQNSSSLIEAAVLSYDEGIHSAAETWCGQLLQGASGSTPNF